MYLGIEFMNSGKGVRLITRGQVPGNVIVEAHRAFAERHLAVFSKVRYWFSNHSALEALLLDHTHARSVATIDHRLAAANPALLVGSLVPGDLEFGMARTWQALAAQTGWRVGTFRDEARLLAFFEETLGERIDLHGPADGPPVVVYGTTAASVS